MNFPFCGSSTTSGFAVSTLYSEIFPSCEPDITYLPSGENVTVHKSTGPNAVWFNNCPVSALQMHNPESNELLAIVLPSLLTATDTTPNEWPDNCWRNSSFLSFTFHTLTVSSKLPVTMKSLASGFFGDSIVSSTSLFAVVSASEAFLDDRPQATAQMLSSWANSCLCSSEYYANKINGVRCTNAICFEYYFKFFFTIFNNFSNRVNCTNVYVLTILIKINKSPGQTELFNLFVADAFGK